MQGWPFWVALPLSATVAGLISAPVGRLSLRVKGVYFFLVTLAFGQVVAGVFAYFEKPFGGWYGIRDIPPPQPAALFTTLDKVPFYYLALALVLVTCWIIHRDQPVMVRQWCSGAFAKATCWRVRSAVDVPGRSWSRSLFRRSSPALAGSLYATYFGYISPLVFTFEYSVNVLVFIVVGGFATMAGPIAGRGRTDPGAGIVPRHRQIPDDGVRADPGGLDAADAARASSAPGSSWCLRAEGDERCRCWRSMA